MKLISMTDFVLVEQMKLNQAKNLKLKHLYSQYLDRIFNYANFLKQPLKLEMFVPCDENGNFLEEPIFHEPNNENEIGNYEKLIEEYYEAKEKVLFEGFVLEKDELINNGILFWVGKFEGNEIIENCISSNLTLTQNAIKRIFG